MRVQVLTTVPRVELEKDLAELAGEYEMEWSLDEVGRAMRTLIMVSKEGHCLTDLLFRARSQGLPVDVVGVVGNHETLRDVAEFYGVPFHHIPVTKETKEAAEAELLGLVDELGVELVVLARYMQILSESLCEKLHGNVINIHHSFRRPSRAPSRTTRRTRAGSSSSAPPPLIPALAPPSLDTKKERSRHEGSCLDPVPGQAAGVQGGPTPRPHLRHQQEESPPQGPSGLRVTTTHAGPGCVSARIPALLFLSIDISRRGSMARQPQSSLSRHDAENHGGRCTQNLAAQQPEMFLQHARHCL